MADENVNVDEVTNVASTEEVATPAVEKPKIERKQYGVDSERFVKVWQGAESAEDAAEQLGMPKNIVLARSAQYRKKGVQLKRMPRENPRRLDVAQLNEVIGVPATKTETAATE